MDPWAQRSCRRTRRHSNRLGRAGSRARPASRRRGRRLSRRRPGQRRGREPWPLSSSLDAPAAAVAAARSLPRPAGTICGGGRTRGGRRRRGRRLTHGDGLGILDASTVIVLRTRPQQSSSQKPKRPHYIVKMEEETSKKGATVAMAGPTLSPADNPRRRAEVTHRRDNVDRAVLASLSPPRGAPR